MTKLLFSVLPRINAKGAISISPDNKNLQIDYARFLYDMGKIDKVASILSKFMDSESKNAELLLMQANISFWKGNLNNARKKIDRIQEIYPNSKITNSFGIYNDVPELLSVSLGSAETTLVQLTNAYCTFVNGGKKVSPIFIDRIQDRRGKTIFNSDQRSCIGCENISYTKDGIPKIRDNFEQIISPETAYQITSILEGVIYRGTGRKLRNLKLLTFQRAPWAYKGRGCRRAAYT